MTDKKIADLPHDTSLAGTEKVPLSPDGYATVQEIANIATELGSWKVFKGDTPWGMVGALFPIENAALEDGGWFGLGMNGNESDFILTRGNATQQSFTEAWSNPNDSNVGSGFESKAYNNDDPTTQAEVTFIAVAAGNVAAILSMVVQVAGVSQGGVSVAATADTGQVTVRAATTQTEPLFKATDNNGQTVFSVSPSGDIEVTSGVGLILRSPDLNRWRIVVNNAGVLSAQGPL